MSPCFLPIKEKCIAMVNEYKTVKEQAQSEFTEKRSRFIGYCKPVKTSQEALDFINEKKSIHWDATHNVYAYIIKDEGVMRYSDDGEPQGTAGIPTLDVLKKNELTDLVVVVTRYFGGILLGGGGLVRAYSHGAGIAVEAAKIITMRLCEICELTCSYNQYGKVSSLVPELDGEIEHTEFTDSVYIRFHIAPEQLGFLNKQLAEATCGEIQAKALSKRYFPAK